MSDEIQFIQGKILVWWDRRVDRPAVHAPTGTNLEFMEQRYIQAPSPKPFHTLDGGAIELRWTTRWEHTKSFQTFWRECTVCGKKFDNI